jgi:hypothetical protein
MPETLAALLFAHVIADFIFQTNWMVAHKRRPTAMAAHIAIVLVTVVVVTGSLHPALFALAVAHLTIDATKVWSPWKGLAPFMADQAAHLASLVLVAFWVPDIWSAGLWAGGLAQTGWLSPVRSNSMLIPPLMILGTGLIIATRAGGFAVGLYMARWQDELSNDTTDHDAKDKNEGLPDGGRAIGLLERGLIFLLVLSGQAASIGFLIAAKSVLRFGAVSDDRKFSEYVIIGTLASFGWAIATAFATVAYLAHLSPLGIPPATP